MFEDIRSQLRLCPIIDEEIDIIKTFSCDNPSMDRYLYDEAYIDHLKRDASTTLVFMEEELIGYFTLFHRRFEIEEVDEDGNARICSRVALELYRIGVTMSRQQQGFGSHILKCIKEIACISNERYITGDVLFERKDWYKKRDFKPGIQAEYDQENESSVVFMYKIISYEELLDKFFNEP